MHFNLLTQFFNKVKVLEVRLFCLILMTSLGATTIQAQDGPENYDEEGNRIYQKQGLMLGVYVGTYFANNHTANLYDGYGFDFEENRHTFENSWMHEKIINQYGGGYGEPDFIGEALNVQPGEWFFDESDMPTNMSYKTAFTAGVSGKYSLDGTNGIIFNVVGTVLTATGNFTITTKPLPGSTQVNNAIKTYNIRGKEERFYFQTGYQRILGKSETLNFFVEGGLHATLAQFESNEIEIEYLRINLYESYYNSVTGATYENGAKPIGIGFGAFLGAGINLRTTGKFDLQLVYNLNLENIKIGYDQRIKPNQGAGLRIYYRLIKK